MGDAVMCPVLHLASLVQRVLRTVPDAGPETPISTMYKLGNKVVVTSQDLRRGLRTACTKGEVTPHLGIQPRTLEQDQYGLWPRWAYS